MRGIPGALLRAALDAHGQVGSKGATIPLDGPKSQGQVNLTPV